MFDLILRDTYNISKTKIINTRLLLASMSNSLPGTGTSNSTESIQRSEKVVLTCIHRQAEPQLPQGAKFLDQGHESITLALYEMGYKVFVVSLQTNQIGLLK